MRLLPFCLLTTSFLAALVLGEESCDASASATDTSKGNECAPNSVDPHDVVINDEDGDGDRNGYDDQHEYDDAPNGEEEASKHPIWWNYSIDQLFEDHFNCAAIIYGYNRDGAQADSGNSLEGDYAQGDSNNTNQDDAVSEAQLEKIRQQWALLRAKYVKEVHLVPIDIHYADGDDMSNYGVSSLAVPTIIGDAGPGKGRGVFAKDDIPKGTLVANIDNGSTGIFKEGHSWREFVVSLPEETACNFIEWSWVQTITPLNDGDDEIRSGLTIFASFDESNLMNAADWDGVEANVSCGNPSMQGGDGQGQCRFQYYATRDIDAGEELLINYAEFEDSSQKGWADIGL